MMSLGNVPTCDRYAEHGGHSTAKLQRFSNLDCLSATDSTKVKSHAHVWAGKRLRQRVSQRSSSAMSKQEIEIDH
jgi:hypothetical protein